MISFCGITECCFCIFFNFNLGLLLVIFALQSRQIQLINIFIQSRIYTDTTPYKNFLSKCLVFKVIKNKNYDTRTISHLFNVTCKFGCIFLVNPALVWFFKLDIILMKIPFTLLSAFLMKHSQFQLFLLLIVDTPTSDTILPMRISESILNTGPSITQPQTLFNIGCWHKTRPFFECT